MISKIEKQYKILIYVKSFLSFQVFMGPVLVIIYTMHINLDFQQFLLLDGILFLLIAFFEIPSGYLADSFGRKKLLLISLIFTLISLIILLLSKSFSGALLSIVISGIFAPMGSGNAEALYYDFFKRNNKMKEMEKIYANSTKLFYLGLFIFSIISGYMASISLIIPIIADCVLLLINILAVKVLLYDDESYTKEAKTFSEFMVNLRQELVNVKNGINNVLLIFLISSLFFTFTRVTYSFYQPVFLQFNVPIKNFGLLFASINLIGFFIMFFYNKSRKILKGEKSVTFFLILLVLLSTLSIYYGLVNNSIVLIIIAITIFQIIRGFSSIYYRIRVNDYIPKDTGIRVTYISLNGFISMMSVAATNIFLNYIMNLYGLEASILIIGIIIFTIVFILYLLNLKLKKDGIIHVATSNDDLSDK